MGRITETRTRAGRYELPAPTPEELWEGWEDWPIPGVFVAMWRDLTWDLDLRDVPKLAFWAALVYAVLFVACWWAAI